MAILLWLHEVSQRILSLKTTILFLFLHTSSEGELIPRLPHGSHHNEVRYTFHRRECVIITTKRLRTGYTVLSTQCSLHSALYTVLSIQYAVDQVDSSKGSARLLNRYSPMNSPAGFK